jgi:hypothetical protein
MAEKEEETQIEIESISIADNEERYDRANIASVATEDGLKSKPLVTKVTKVD